MGSVNETSTSEGDGRKYQVKHHLNLMKVDISVTLGISEFINIRRSDRRAWSEIIGDVDSGEVVGYIRV
jgi:hypothetical protein